MSINNIINFKENVPQNVKNALNKIGNNKKLQLVICV